MSTHDHEREVEARTARTAAPAKQDTTASGVLALQQTAGNAATANLLARDGQPLDGATRTDMEAQFGTDFGDVRVHTGETAHASAKAVDAAAYTVGSDIVFASGQYDPASPAGRHLLAHELTHVVQQRHGPVEGTAVVGGVRVSEPTDAYEREAAATADRVVAGPAIGVPQATAAPIGVARQAAGEATVVEDPVQVADDFEGDALAYFEDHMRVELMAAAGSEGVAIGRRASEAALNRIRAVCDPYEADLELDALVLNTVFAATSGGASVGEGFSSGPKPGAEMGTGGANLASRAFRGAQSMLQVWLPRLAGYRTVGSLREAASREASEAANRAGEGGSASFAEYQEAAMKALHDDWSAEVRALKQGILRNKAPSGVASLMLTLLKGKRPEYLTRLRTKYGAAGEVGASVASGIAGSLNPRLNRLRDHLEEAKEHRENVMAGSAIAGGALGGAAIGAGIGAFFGGIGAVPGAIIGGAVGLIGGIAGAVAIKWD